VDTIPSNFIPAARKFGGNGKRFLSSKGYGDKQKYHSSLFTSASDSGKK